MLRQIEWWVQNGPITKNGVLPVATLFFWKFCFSLRTSYKEFIWCTNDPNDHIHTFRKRCSYIWGCFFPVSILKRKIHYPFKWIQLIEWSNYLNMNSRLHLSNKLKECGKFLWMRLWNLCFISMKESIFSKVAGCKPVTSLNWSPS